jgi:DNA-binding SARP family transcriptional activator
MGLLRLAVLGPPEVMHDGNRLTFALRKAQALLLYLAVEQGTHSRSKLAAFLWPDSAPHDARTALRNAIALLRTLLADPDASSAMNSHLLSPRDQLGLNPQAPFELDLAVVQEAYAAAQQHPTMPAEPQRAVLVAKCQQALALVRGPFLDGLWLGEESPFDEWVLQEQQQWQVRVQLLCERLSAFQEVGGELEQARATLTRWLALDALSEEAYRRLMCVHLGLGDPTAALQVYSTCRARLAQELQVKPSAETVALVERIRTTAAARRGTSPVTTAGSRSTGELLAPLVGRSAAFSQLVGSFQQARGGQPQAVLVVGEAGIGKTRLAREWVAWAAAQGALVLAGQAFEMGGRLPYQPLVEALRPRLEVENAPEDLLEDVWLAELSRLLPELRVRYPDLPTPTEDELIARGRLFEAVARLFDALARNGPLVLLLDDLQWVDEASLDLLRYISRYWIKHGSRVLLLLTVRSEEFEFTAPLAAHVADLGRDLPLSQVLLQTLSQAETLQLVQAITGVGTVSTRTGDEKRERGPDQPFAAGPSSAAELETQRSTLGDVLFAQTDGQPLYLLETLKLLRDRQWLVPRLDADGVVRLELAVEITTVVAQERSQGALLPPSVRALILARLASLSQAARHLVQGVAVLATAANALLLWQLAEIGVREGVEGLEEAVKSGILREEEAGGPGVGNLVTYRFSHDLMRDVVYTELGAARRQVLHQRALVCLQTEGIASAELAYHARASGETEAAFGYSVHAGIGAVAVFAVADAIGYYEQARALLKAHPWIESRLAATEVERLYVHLGQAYVFQNDWEQARDAYEELLTYARQHQQTALASMTLNRLAILVVQHSNDKPRVQALLEDAWRMAETSADQKALAETEWNRAQIIGVVWDDPTRGLPHGEQVLALARESLDRELEARSLNSLGWIHIRAGDFQQGIDCLEAALALYAALGNEQSASRELSLSSFGIGAPLTQPLTNRASEASCWALLAYAQVHAGQVQPSIRSGRMALALSTESKNVWTQIGSMRYLTYGLLDAGAYEEALGLMQAAIALARTLPPTLIFQGFLYGLSNVYHALQQWEEARSRWEEAEAMTKTLDLAQLRVVILSQLCMNYAVAGQWGQAYTYAVQAMALRESYDRAMILLDFYPHYETEALLRGGNERQARAAMRRLGEGPRPSPRFRIPYLRSMAVLAAWEGRREQAIGHLREAAELAAEMGLPGEQWQIQAALGTVYEAGGEAAQAHTVWAKASRIIQVLAEGIKDEALRARFLAGPQIHPVLQHVQGEVSPVSKDQAEPNGR